MPDKMSQEKIRLLRAFGARVVITPTAVAPDDPRSYYSVSTRIAEETPNKLLRQSVPQSGQPSHPLRDDRARDLATDRRPDRRLRLRDGHGGHHLRCGPFP